MIERLRQWLLPGMGVKRWLVVNLAGASLAIVGIMLLIGLPVWERFGWVFRTAYLRLLTSNYALPLGIILFAGGLSMAYVGVRRMSTSIARVVAPDSEVNLRELFFRRRQMERAPKIVVIGGGSGLSMLLRGLKAYSANLTAIVTVADDGGSSGRLRRDFGVLPPGDIRNCLVALSDAEGLMTDLFNYRFDQGEGLAGHNFGNLFLAAMNEVQEGNFIEAIKAASKVLAVRGRVLPATLSSLVLVAEFDNGEVLRGESNIGRTARRIAKLRIEPEEASALPEVLEAIHEADAIILGPGSLYTSIMPNLCIQEIVEAINRSPALVAYICNIMTQPGETTGHSAADHLEALHTHAGSNLCKYIVVNTGALELSPGYMQEGGRPVVFDEERLREMGVNVVTGDFVLRGTETVRHDTEMLAKTLIDLIVKEQYTLERRRALIEQLHKLDV